jgi:hypothetical protein
MPDKNGSEVASIARGIGVGDAADSSGMESHNSTCYSLMETLFKAMEEMTIIMDYIMI